MTSQKKRRFQQLFGQCILPCSADLTPQVDYSINLYIYIYILQH